MPQRDKYHQSVRNALSKAGWQITHDPLTFRLEDIRVYIDLAAATVDDTIIAERDTEQIAVEIKVLEPPGVLEQFEQALGQYLVYRTILRLYSPDYRLYLAIPEQAYYNLFQGPTIQAIINENQIHLVVFDPVAEEIVLWSV